MAEKKENIEQKTETPKVSAKEKNWTLDDYLRNGKLNELKINNPERHKELCKKKFRVSEKK